MSRQNDNDFLSSSQQTLKSPSPRVYCIQSEKKIKLENGQITDTVDEPEDSLTDPSSLTQSSRDFKVKLNGKSIELLDNSLNSSTMWTSTENSFVQVTDKLLHRGIQTDYANGQIITQSNANSLNPPALNDMTKRESMYETLKMECY